MLPKRDGLDELAKAKNKVGGEPPAPADEEKQIACSKDSPQ